MNIKKLIDKLSIIRSWNCRGDADMYATITAAIETLEGVSAPTAVQRWTAKGRSGDYETD